jgi:hypothetical protein
MACDITKGRLDTPCKTGVGGVKAFYFANFEPLIYKQFEKTDGLVTSLLTSPTTPLELYKYELRSSGHNLEDANENSEETGTSFVTSTFTAILKQIGATTRDELQLASFGRPQVFVEDYNGNFLLVGIENGCTVSVNQVTGSAMGELSGYNLTITAQERELSYLVDPTIIGDDTQTTIVVGT